MTEYVQFPTSGDCYDSSLKNAVELSTIKRHFECSESPDATIAGLYICLQLANPIQIVHGWATSPNGSTKDVRIHHAWIEVGDMVIETQGGMRYQKCKSLYYSVFQIYPNETYTVEEAEMLACKNGYGPWRGKGGDRQNGEDSSKGEQVVAPNGP